MQSEPSSITWLAIADRRPMLPAGERLLCWFRFASGLRAQIGHYTSRGEIQILNPKVQPHLRGCCQLDMMVEQPTHWRPVDEDRLEELENRQALTGARSA